MIKYENFFLYLISTILILFFLINLYQISTQHWSALIDMDIIVIYNSLLISSGYEQEYRDHPAFTTFLIIGGIFKLLSFFQDSYSANIDVILSSQNIDKTFQYYFIVARIINYFINILLIYFFYKFLNLLKIEKTLNYSICLILIFSQWYSMSFFALRSEILSIVFFTIAMMFILSKKRDIVLNYFIAGIFLALAMLTKIQILFFIAFPIFLIPIFYLDKGKQEATLIKSKILSNYLILSLILGIIFYVVLQIFIQDHPRFERNKYLDLFFFLLSFSIISFYYLFYNKYNLALFKKNILLLSSILNGFIFLIFVFIFLDQVNFLDINNFIFLRITNPIHYLTEFTNTFAEGTVSTNFLIKSAYEILSNYSFSLLELFSLLFIVFLNIKKNYNIDNQHVIFVIILLLIFLMNSTINSFSRGYIYYHSYYTFCYLVVLSVCVNNFKNKYSNYFIYFIFIIFTYNSFNFDTFPDSRRFFYKEVFNRKIELTEICKDLKLQKNLRKPPLKIHFFQYYQEKFNDRALNNLCGELKS